VRPWQQDTSKELEAELAKLERPNEIISVEPGAQRATNSTRSSFAQNLSKDQHAMLLRLHVLSALAVGNSAGAVAQAANLKNFPETPENLRAAWLAAGAAATRSLRNKRWTSCARRVWRARSHWPSARRGSRTSVSRPRRRTAD